MKINLSPVRSDESQPSVTKSGDIITVNGEAFDFSDVTEGATLPADAIVSDWIVGDVTRLNGTLELTIKITHGANAPEATRFPSPILNPQDGEIALPLYDVEPETF